MTLITLDALLICYRCGYPVERFFLRCPECGFPTLRSRAIWRYWQRAAPRVLSVALIPLLSIGLFMLHMTAVIGDNIVNDVVLMLCSVAVAIAIQRLLAMTPRPGGTNLWWTVSGLAAVFGGLCASASLAVLARDGRLYTSASMREAIGVATWGASMGVFWLSMGATLRGLSFPPIKRHAGILAVLWPVATFGFGAMVWNQWPDYTVMSPIDWIISFALLAVVVYTALLTLVLWWKVEARATT